MSPDDPATPSFVARPPPEVLAPTVRLLWACSRPGLVHAERVLPSGSCQLLINLAHDRLSWADRSGTHHVGGAAIGGPFTRAIFVAASEQAALVGAVFRPGGLRAYLDRPTHVLENGYLGLDALWPRERTAPVLEAMRATTPDRALHMLAWLLRAHLEGGPDPLVAHAARALARPRARVDRLAADLGVSPRLLADRFRAAVGLRPKGFARIARFRKAFEEIGPSTDLGALSWRAGYADQAHLNHDFRALSGLSPSAWLRGTHPFASHRLEAAQFSPSDPDADA